MKKSHVSFVENNFLHFVSTFLLMCHLYNRCVAIENTREIAFIRAKSLSVIMMWGKTLSSIIPHKTSRTQLKLSSLSCCRNINAIKKVMLVDIIPTISRRGIRYLLVLCVQSMSNTCGNTCNKSKLVGCAKNKSVTASLSSLVRCHSMYCCSTNSANNCYIWDLLPFSFSLYLCRALETAFMLVVLRGYFFFIVTKMSFGHTLLLDMSFNNKYSSSDNLLT